MLNQELLKILVCPESKQDLDLGEDEFVSRLNAAISEGRISNRAGKKVEEKIDGVLIRKDGQYFYLIREDIPIMLIEEGVAMEQLA